MLEAEAFYANHNLVMPKNLFFFFDMEQTGLENDRAGGRDGTALVHSDLQNVCRSVRDNRKYNRAKC